MNFFKIFIIIFFITFAGTSYADNHDKKQEVLDQVKDIAKELEEDEEVPLNDPFAGNEGTSGMASNIPEEEQDNQLSLYNFKLVGIIAGKKNSYASLVSQDGRNIILQLDEELYDGFKLVDLRLNEAIFKKADNTFVSINFKNQIREIK